jgi:hypothetical protein
MPEIKLGGSGVCQKCKRWVFNLAFHEARCNVVSIVVTDNTLDFDPLEDSISED